MADLQIESGENIMFVDDKLDSDDELNICIWTEENYTHVFCNKEQLKKLFDHINKVLEL